MNCAGTFIEESTENEISNPELGNSLLEEYQKIKKGKLLKKYIVSSLVKSISL